MLNGKVLLLFGVLLAAPLLASCDEDYASNPVVQLFQEYIRINTTTGNDLEPAVNFWTKLAAEACVSIKVHEIVEGYPIIVLRWQGSNSSLGSIMLNSHMDVVPANEDDGWTYPPFDAVLADGAIYGRGTQDTKSLAIQHYEALKTLKEDGVTLLRDVYMTLMPDEEVGGVAGMIPFLTTEAFAKMNVALEMDEGTSYPIPQVPIFYQDKSVWQIQVDCYGEAAHGSTFPSSNATATGKCLNVMNTMMAFRDEQYEIANAATIYDAGVYTSVNLNRLSGGTANNVIPNQISLTYDIRLGTRVDETEFQEQLESWVYSGGDNINITYISKNNQSPATVVSADNPYWVSIAAAASDLGITILPIIPPGSTDARHVRSAGVPAFGFSYMPNTTLLLHSVDEHLDASILLEGIEVYKAIILGLANIPGSAVGASSDYLYDTAN